MTSKGKIFYIQERVGINTATFNMLKFRTMIQDSEKNGPVWARDDDQRITSIGKVLRKTGLDELPQLINVLKNEMSIIGPRPERMHFAGKFMDIIPNYLLRYSVKPGITGLAQINYKYDESIMDVQKKLRYDILYIKNANVLLDLFIILSTVKLMSIKILKLIFT